MIPLQFDASLLCVQEIQTQLDVNFVSVFPRYAQRCGFFRSSMQF